MRVRGFEIVSSYEGKGNALPTRKTKYSAGYDLSAAETVVIPPKEMAIVPTGIKAYMNSNEVLKLHIRSSLAFNNRLSLVNSTGIIDSDYYNNPKNEGHILVGIRNDSEQEFVVQKGNCIAQGIFLEYRLADGDNVTEERNGGIGSTGK